METWKRFFKQQDKSYMKFIVIYVLFMAARAIFNPFITVYLQEKGFGIEKIGIITGINSCVIILAQPFWGILSDKFASVKGTLIVCLCFQAFLALSLVFCNAYLMVTMIFCMYTFFSSPEGPLLDTWCLSCLKDLGLKNDLGRMKVLGCFGYAGFSIVSGIVIAKYSTTTMLPIFSAVLFLIAIVLLWSNQSVQRNNKRSHLLKEFYAMKQDKTFLLFLLFIFLMQLPHRAAYTFYPVYIQQLGGNERLVGYTSAVMFVSEGICMFVSKKLFNKYKPIHIIMSSGIFFLLWQIGYSMISSPWQIVLLGILDGPSYGLFCIGVLYFLDQNAPNALRTTYQTIAYAVYFGLSGILGNNLGGKLITQFGFSTMYRLGAVMISSAVLGCYILGRGDRRKEKINV